MANFWSESLSMPILCVCEQRWLLQVCAIYTDLPEPSLLDDAMSTKMVYAQAQIRYSED